MVMATDITSIKQEDKGVIERDQWENIHIFFFTVSNWSISRFENGGVFGGWGEIRWDPAGGIDEYSKWIETPRMERDRGSQAWGLELGREIQRKNGWCVTQGCCSPDIYSLLDSGSRSLNYACLVSIQRTWILAFFNAGYIKHLIFDRLLHKHQTTFDSLKKKLVSFSEWIETISTNAQGL